jgi:hypothetical protein
MAAVLRSPGQVPVFKKPDLMNSKALDKKSCKLITVFGESIRLQNLYAVGNEPSPLPWFRLRQRRTSNSGDY